MSPKESNSKRFYKRWSLFHSLINLLGLALYLIYGSFNWWLIPTLCSFVGLVTYLFVVVGHLPFRVGYANITTLIRLASIGILGWFFPLLPNEQLFLAFLGIVALDGLDGYLARRYQHDTLLGGWLDMETDAFYVLLLVLIHSSNASIPEWLILPGALRYIYGLLTAAKPTGKEFTSKKFRSTIAVIFFLSLLTPFVLGSKWVYPVVTFSGALIVTSFGLSLLAYLRHLYYLPVKKSEGSLVVAKASVAYALLSFLPSALNFLLLPLYLKYIPVENYAQLALINVYTGLFAVFGLLQINAAASTQYFKGSTDKKLFRQTFVILGVLLVLLTYGLFAISGPLFFNLLENSLPFYPLGFVALTASALAQIHGLVFIFLKNDYQIKPFAFFNLLLVVLALSFQVFFIVQWEMGISGIIYGTLVSKVIVVPLLFIVFRSWIWPPSGSAPFSQMKLIAKAALVFSLAFLPSVLLNWIQVLGDRFIAEQFLSLENLGKYALLMTLLFLPKTLTNSITSAMRPRLMHMLNEKDDSGFRDSEFLYVVVLGLTYLGVLFIGTHLEWFTSSSKYLEIRSYFFLAVITTFPGAMIYFKHLKLMQMEKTAIISRYFLYAVIVQVVLLVLLLPVWGINGALVAIGIGNTVNYVFNFQKTKSFGFSEFLATQSPALLVIISALLGLMVVPYLGITLTARLTVLLGILSLSILCIKHKSRIKNVIGIASKK